MAEGVDGGSVSLLLRHLFALAIRNEVYGKHQEAVAKNDLELTLKAKAWAKKTLDK